MISLIAAGQQCIALPYREYAYAALPCREYAYAALLCMHTKPCHAWPPRWLGGVGAYRGAVRAVVRVQCGRWSGYSVGGDRGAVRVLIGIPEGTGADQGAVRALTELKSLTQILKPRHITKNRPNLVKKVLKCSAYKYDHSQIKPDRKRFLINN